MGTFVINKDQEIVLNTAEGVFVPTGTTKELIKAVSSYVKKLGKLLDLGCGSGAVGLALHQSGVVESPLYASDISQHAVDCLGRNASLNHCSVVPRCGSLFDPWENEKFDYIVDDVAGVAQEIAAISPWYNNVPCASGVDGTRLVCKMIEEAPQYLNPRGLLFFPVISFSNIQIILKTAQDHFSHLEKLSHAEWPLPKEMYAHVDLLKRLQAENQIEYIEKFGMVLYFSDVYVAY